jgi:hypothetical protein
VKANYDSRSIIYARGLADFGNDDSDCSPSSQGYVRRANRWSLLIDFHAEPIVASASSTSLPRSLLEAMMCASSMSIAPLLI